MADTKTTALPANGGLVGTDIFPMVDDPGGTPATEKATITQLQTFIKENTDFANALHPEPVIGRYYGPSGSDNDAGNGAGITGVVRAAFFVVGKRMTFDRICVYVNTLGAGSELMRVGIWEANANGSGGALIVDSGDIDVGSTGSTGDNEVTISETLDPGCYLIGGAVSSGSPSIARYLNGEDICHFGGADVAAAAQRIISSTFTYGALPDPWPATGLAYVTSSAPWVALRRSA